MKAVLGIAVLSALLGCGASKGVATAGAADAVGGDASSASTSAAGAEGGAPSLAPLDEQDPLVGTWTFTGRVPATVTLVMTFKQDKTLVFDEDVAPSTSPAGSMPSTCVTSATYAGTYEASGSSGDGQLTWTFSSGTRNRISGCEDPMRDSPGVPMTEESVTSYIGQGMLPPHTVDYVVNADGLRLSSDDASGGVGRDRGTQFARVP